VRVRGKRLDQAIVLAAGATPTQPVQIIGRCAVPGTTGAQSTLAILVNFSDAPRSRSRGDRAERDLRHDQRLRLRGFLSADDADRRRGRLVHDLGDERQLQLQQHRVAGQSAAAAAGFSLSSYARFVYIFPPTPCGWWGLGSVGGYPSPGLDPHPYGFNVTVVAHEMGHNSASTTRIRSIAEAPPWRLPDARRRTTATCST
jgi:hypothetical protein